MGLFGGTKIHNEYEPFNYDLAFSRVLASGRDYITGENLSRDTRDQTGTIFGKDAFGNPMQAQVAYPEGTGGFDGPTGVAAGFNRAIAELDRQYRDSVSMF